MSTLVKDKTTGKWVVTASGTNMWVGTRAELAAGLAAGTIPEGTAVMVTDDYEAGIPLPDWENVTEYTLAQLQAGITMPGNGLFVMAGISSDASGSCDINLNGHPIARAATQPGCRSLSNAQIPVNKGDAITHSGTSINTGSAFFVPYKNA